MNVQATTTAAHDDRQPMMKESDHFYQPHHHHNNNYHLYSLNQYGRSDPITIPGPSMQSQRTDYKAWLTRQDTYTTQSSSSVWGQPVEVPQYEEIFTMDL